MVCRLKIATYFAATIIVVASVTFKDTINVNKGERFTLPCKNDTGGLFMGIVWKENTTELYSSWRSYGLNINEKIYKRSKLVKGTSLQIMNANVNDAGMYKCHLIYKPKGGTTLHANIFSVMKVVVFARPNITSLYPSVQYQSLGQKAEITCVFKGIPSANVTWTFDGKKDLTKKYKTNSSTSVLKLRRLRRKDTGFYTCVAYNRAGKIEKRAYIKVMYAPRIFYITRNPHINVGSNGTITCRARGYPVPEMFWHFVKGRTRISLSSGDTYKKKFSASLTKKNRMEEWSESVLTIYSVQPEDWQVNFTCVASSDQGSRIKLVYLEGFRKPDPPELIEIQTTSSKALLRWSVPMDGGSKITAYVLEYRNATETKWISVEIPLANVGSFEVKDLKPNTRYVFRISAKNAFGMSAFSELFQSATEKEEDLGNHSDRDGTVKPSKQGTRATGKSNGGILGSLDITAIVGIAGGVLLVIMLCVAVFCHLNQHKPANSQTTSMLGSRPVSMENGSLAPPEGRRPSEMPSENTEFIPLLTRADHWEFPRDRLRLSTVLGSGAFGMVMRGDAQGLRGSNGSVKVAVKIAKDSDNEYARKDLHAELDMLKLLPEHPNVVGLLGCCTRNEPLMIIVEYCVHGDLQGFLRNSRGISESYYKSTYHPIGLKMTSKMLLTFALQIANGMSHLATFKVIHRDLAARNILVDENLVCKISDFGFARDVYIEDQYMKKSKGGRFPIKWMALESLLDGISTPKSDVWAFGVVLWEIVTLGASPYPGMNSYEVVSFLQDGFRMDKPKHCSDELYALSINCWHLTPQRRPTFDELANMLQEMLDEDKEYINMNFYQDHLYENFDVNLACHSSANGSAIELNPNETTPLAAAAIDTVSATSS